MLLIIMKQFSFVLAFTLNTFLSYSCDICGSFMGITPHDNRSYVQLMHRFRLFNGYRVYNQPSSLVVPGSYWRTLHGDDTTHSAVQGTNPYSTFDYESYKVVELRGKWFFHKRWELSGILPFVENKSRRNNVQINVQSLADPSVMIAYHLVQKLDHPVTRHRLIVGIGFKAGIVPDDKTDLSGKRIDIMLQPGSGSSDVFYYLNYIGLWRNLGWNSNTMLKHSFTNHHSEQFAPAWNQTLVLFYKISVKNVQLMPALNSNFEYTKGVYKAKQLQTGTGMQVIMSGPSVDVVVKRMVISAGYQINVYERLSSANNLSSASRLFAGLTYNFGK